jgi:hypothetical protein
VYMDLVEKPEEKRPLGRPRRRWEDNIKMDLQEAGCGVWTGLSWLRTDRWQAPVNAAINLLVPKNAGNFLTSCKPVSFRRRIPLYGVTSIFQHVSIRTSTAIFRLKF